MLMTMTTFLFKDACHVQRLLVTTFALVRGTKEVTQQILGSWTHRRKNELRKKKAQTSSIVKGIYC